ncbi:FitA-like ribbon-helix-helix domain-containing protein [Paraburkholderia sp.]|uniref:FitA-like ribbon-helix-helix domain-containing protein n=1 Tax=Paraburkholderia sp. TaxID=1926495 RepID=UPI0039799C33
MTIRNIDDQLKARLRIQAATHGRSMEDEARDILRAALSAEPIRGDSLVSSIRARIEPLGGLTWSCRSERSFAIQWTLANDRPGYQCSVGSATSGTRGLRSSVVGKATARGAIYHKHHAR